MSPYKSYLLSISMFTHHWEHLSMLLIALSSKHHCAYEYIICHRLHSAHQVEIKKKKPSWQRCSYINKWIPLQITAPVFYDDCIKKSEMKCSKLGPDSFPRLSTWHKWIRVLLWTKWAESLHTWMARSNILIRAFANSYLIWWLKLWYKAEQPGVK